MQECVVGLPSSNILSSESKICLNVGLSCGYVMVTMATLSVPDLFTTDLGFSCPALPHEGGKLGRTGAGEGESLG